MFGLKEKPYQFSEDELHAAAGALRLKPILAPGLEESIIGQQGYQRLRGKLLRQVVQGPPDYPSLTSTYEVGLHYFNRRRLTKALVFIVEHPEAIAEEATSLARQLGETPSPIAYTPLHSFEETTIRTHAIVATLVEHAKTAHAKLA